MKANLEPIGVSYGHAQSFQDFSMGTSQREYAEYIAEAKRGLRRLEKILPMIASSMGLNDKYRK